MRVEYARSVTVSESGHETVPPSVRRASVLLLAESAALFAAGVSVLALAAIHDTTRLWAAFVIAFFALGGGAFLLFASRGLSRLQAAYRSPVVLVQLLAIPVAIGLVQGGRWFVGLPILALAVAVIVLLFRADARAELDRTI